MRELKIKKGRPLLNYVILTADRYTAEELTEYNNGIIDPKQIGQLKPYQKIISISPRVLGNSSLEEGQLVLINIDRYGRSVQKKNSYVQSDDEYYDASIVYQVPIIELDGKECLRLGDNDIEFIIDEFSIENAPKPKIISKKPSKIILPDTSIVH